MVFPVPRVKICCISDVAEAQLAVRHGASALGLVSHMPSGPGVISDHKIAEIVDSTPPPIATFLLTSLRDAESIVRQHSICKTSVIQLVDQVDPSQLLQLKPELPSVKLIQVIHVVGPQSLDEAMAAAEHVDALLLDSGNPNLKIKELGGTGRVHDWEISRRIRERVSIPVFLAGGLNANNLAQAIRIVQPFGVDVCSGVRESGKLCDQRLEAFFNAVRATVS